MAQLRRLASGVHVTEAPLRFLGLELGTRMTVLDGGSGLLVHSPIAVDPSVVEALGEPRWVLAPNLFHHLYIGPWADAGLQAWGAPGLPAKRDDIRFEGVIEAGTQPSGPFGPFGNDLQVHALRCFPMTNEVVVLHRPSRTLVVSDLVFNIAPGAPWLTRAAMRCLCGYPGCSTTVLERLAMRRDLARQDLAVITAWDFDRVVMAHGEVIETGGKQALLAAFGWLGTLPMLE